MRPTCSEALQRAGLRPVIHCSDSGAAPPTCTGSAWATALLYEGSTSGGGRQRSAACAQRAFDQYLCRLPAQGERAGELRPADWAFGAEPPTIGKFVARVAMQLYLGMAAASPAFRPMLRGETLRQWSWRPPLSACPPHARDNSSALEDATGAWMLADVCDVAVTARRRATPPARVEAAAAASRAAVGDGAPTSRTMARLLEIVRGNSSGRWPRTHTDLMWMATAGGGVTSAGLWVAGQTMRHARSAMGPCTRALVDALLSQSRAVLQRARRRCRIGLHIRRGDACERWASRRADDETLKRRPCFHTATYLEAARALAAVLARDPRQCIGASGARMHAEAPATPATPATPSPPVLLLATDSPHVLEELQALLRPGEFEVVAAPAARGVGWGGVSEATPSGRTHEAAAEDFIEARNARGLIDRAAALSSFFADLELLSAADAFVGTAASWTSRAALLAIVGERGVVPPFAMVDRPLKQLWFS